MAKNTLFHFKKQPMYNVAELELMRDFGRSNNLNMFMFANNRDFGKLFTVKHKRVRVVFDEQGPCMGNPGV